MIGWAVIRVVFGCSLLPHCSCKDNRILHRKRSQQIFNACVQSIQSLWNPKTFTMFYLKIFLSKMILAQHPAQHKKPLHNTKKHRTTPCTTPRTTPCTTPRKYFLRYNIVINAAMPCLATGQSPGQHDGSGGGTKTWPGPAAPGPSHGYTENKNIHHHRRKKNNSRKYNTKLSTRHTLNNNQTHSQTYPLIWVALRQSESCQSH